MTASKAVNLIYWFDNESRLVEPSNALIHASRSHSFSIATTLSHRCADTSFSRALLLAVWPHSGDTRKRHFCQSVHLSFVGRRTSRVARPDLTAPPSDPDESLYCLDTPRPPFGMPLPSHSLFAPERRLCPLRAVISLVVFLGNHAVVNNHILWVPDGYCAHPLKPLSPQFR